MGAKLHESKGKQPRPLAKVPKSTLSARKVVLILLQPGGWLRSSHPLKKA